MAHPETGAVGVPETGASGDFDPVAAIAATLDDDKRYGTDEPADEITGDEPDEDAPELEADEADGEGQDADEDGEPGSPAIAPPVSWKAEHKAAFAELPPELQQVVVEREAERERAFQAKATEAANARRDASAEVSALAERQLAEIARAYEERLTNYVSAPMPPAPDPSLIEADPVEFLKQDAAYRSAIAQRQQAQQDAAEARAMQEDVFNRQRQRALAETNSVLADSLEGWNDDAKRPVIAKELTSFATAHGYDPERLSEADATDILFLHAANGWKSKAEKWDAYQARRMETVRAAKDLPKVSRPNAAQPAGSAKATGIRKQSESFRSTGSVDDAAALIRNFL